MKTESMIERVARAMVAADSGPEGSALFDFHWAEFGEGYMESARVAIAAMRKPTKSMLDAATPFADDDGPATVWLTMIDAALSEEGE